MNPMRRLLIAAAAAILLLPTVAQARPIDLASARFDEAKAAIETTHDITGSAIRCYRIARRRVECPFALSIVRPDGVAETCVGALTVGGGSARFRNGVRCQVTS